MTDINYSSEMPAPTDNKKKTIWIIVIVVAVLLLCCCCCISMSLWWLWNNGDALLSEFGALHLPLLL